MKFETRNIADQTVASDARSARRGASRASRQRLTVLVGAGCLVFSLFNAVASERMFTYKCSWRCWVCYR
jgi:hypothetical protein